MVPPFNTEISSNGKAAVAEPERQELNMLQEQQTTQENRSVRSQVIEAIEPLQKQLDAKLHELDASLRPRLSQPVQNKPLLSVAISAGVGMLFGAIAVLGLMAGGRSTAE